MRLPPALLGAAFLLLGSCATISTAGMSDHCKNLYNSCLNSCPDAAPRGAPPSTGPSSGQGHLNVNVGVASCTDDCNAAAKKCK